MLKLKIFSIVLALSLAGCYHPKTHGKFVTEHKDAWIDGYSVSEEEHKDADQGLVFCRANIKDNGTAEPTCFKPKFEDKVTKASK